MAEKTFRERFMDDETTFDEIFDLTDEWSDSDTNMPLREYLGLNAREEEIWVEESDEALEDYMEQEKNTRIFFTDLDGTALTDDKQITPATRKAFDEILEQGHIVVICTGRALASAIKQAHMYGLDRENCYIISFNGGQIYDVTADKIIYSASVPKDIVRTLFDEAEKCGVNIQTYTRKGVVTEHDNPDFREYLEIQMLDGEVLPDVMKKLTKAPAKVLGLCSEDLDRLARFGEHVKEMFGDQLDVFGSSGIYLEIVPKGVNKGEAVHFLCRYLGIPEKNSVAAGDSDNDIPMLREAQVGAAMINAHPTVKEVSDYITVNDNNHDGVEEIIRKFILN